MSKPEPTTDGWRNLQKIEAHMKGGSIVCKSSCALRIKGPCNKSTTVFGCVTIQETISSSPKLFRIVYDGITADGKHVSGNVELPNDFWKLDAVKVKSRNAKARLLLMRFFDEKVCELQLTIPILSHEDSKRSKAVIESLLVYGAHYVNNKDICVGKKALGLN
jgi:hypothetical protein